LGTRKTRSNSTTTTGATPQRTGRSAWEPARAGGKATDLAGAGAHLGVADALADVRLLAVAVAGLHRAEDGEKGKSAASPRGGATRRTNRARRSRSGGQHGTAWPPPMARAIGSSALAPDAAGSRALASPPACRRRRVAVRVLPFRVLALEGSACCASRSGSRLLLSFWRRAFGDFVRAPGAEAQKVGGASSRHKDVVFCLEYNHKVESTRYS